MTGRKWWHRGGGYSLMELVIVITLGTVAMPAIISMFTTVFTNSHKAEFMTIAELLAVEQMEIILADKAGTGVGYGYAAIDNAKYADVNPTGDFASFTRTVNVTLVNPGDPYEYKLVTVSVSHPLIPTVTLSMALFEHSGIPS